MPCLLCWFARHVLVAESPTDLMLIDLLVSNYVRAMYAARVEGQSIWFTDHFGLEMFEVMRQGLQPYIHGSQVSFTLPVRISVNHVIHATEHACRGL